MRITSVLYCICSIHMFLYRAVAITIKLVFYFFKLTLFFSFKKNFHIFTNNQKRTVVSPYVGTAQKQDGGSNGCISNYMAITQLGVGFNLLFRF